MRPNAKVECVEISSVVIQLARKFFGLARVENRNNNVAYGSGSLRIIHDDGRHYISKEIQQGRAGWDAIILDAYAHGLPSMLRTTNFFQLLQKSVSSQGGVIISNLDVSGTNGQMNNKVSRLLQGYSVVFGHENMSELDLGASKVVLVLVDCVVLDVLILVGVVTTAFFFFFFLILLVLFKGFGLVNITSKRSTTWMSSSMVTHVHGKSPMDVLFLRLMI